MKEILALPTKVYQLNQPVYFLETEVGNLVYNLKAKKLESTKDDHISFCKKNNLKVVEVEMAWVEDLVEDEKIVYSLDSSFLSQIQKYSKEKNQRDKELNTEMYVTLAIGIVIAIIGSFLI